MVKPITQKEGYMANKEIESCCIEVIQHLARKYKFEWRRGGGNIIIMTTHEKFKVIKREYENILYYEYGIMFPEPIILMKKRY